MKIAMMKVLWLTAAAACTLAGGCASGGGGGGEVAVVDPPDPVILVADPEPVVVDERVDERVKADVAPGPRVRPARPDPAIPRHKPEPRVPEPTHHDSGGTPEPHPPRIDPTFNPRSK